MVESLARVPRELLPYIDCWTVQEPYLVDLEIVNAIQAQMDEGRAWLFQDADTYAFMCRQTPWVADMHIYNTGSTWSMVRAVRAITREALKRFPKLEARTPDQRIGRMIERCGWRQEAVYRSAFRTREGKFLDEYGYGVTTWERL